MKSLQCGGQLGGAIGHNLHRGLAMAGSTSSSLGWSIAPPGILVGSISYLMGP
jgi:hypothetical protein